MQAPGAITPIVPFTVACRFQSSPDASTGCNRCRRGQRRRGAMFQSSPDASTGCNADTETIQTTGTEFQSSPDASTGCNDWCSHAAATYAVFQSSPDASTGCNRLSGSCRVGSCCFNPHPMQAPGAMCYRCTVTCRQLVSILTRCKHRVQYHRCASGRPDARFNPHPMQAPGAMPLNSRNAQICG